ncbi:unnamed protein product [Prunus brigantina]
MDGSEEAKISTISICERYPCCISSHCPVPLNCTLLCLMLLFFYFVVVSLGQV